MSVKKLLLYILAVFLLLMLNFAAVYGYVALTNEDGFPIVGSECSTVAIGLLALELLLWWLIDYRRNRQAYELPADTPARRDAQRDMPQEVLTLDRHSLRTGEGHPGQRIRPKQILAPIAGVLAFAVAGYAAIYFSFHFLVFNIGYHGDPAVFGEEYRGATVVTSRYNDSRDEQTFVLRTTDGKQHTLVLDGNNLLHPGRYRYLPENPAPDANPSFWAEIELILDMIFFPIVWGVSVFISYRIKPKEPKEKPEEKLEE